MTSTSRSAGFVPVCSLSMREKKSRELLSNLDVRCRWHLVRRGGCSTQQRHHRTKECLATQSKHCVSVSRRSSWKQITQLRQPVPSAPSFMPSTCGASPRSGPSSRVHGFPLGIISRDLGRELNSMIFCLHSHQISLNSGIRPWLPDAHIWPETVRKRHHPGRVEFSRQHQQSRNPLAASERSGP